MSIFGSAIYASEYPGFETLPWQAVYGISARTSGDVLFTYFTPTTPQPPITKLATVVDATAAATTTLARMGLYSIAANGDATLVARTASDTTLWNATNTEFERVLSTTGGYPAAYSLIPGQRYASATIDVGTTVPAMAGVSGGNFKMTPRRTAIITGQTDLAASYTNAQLSTTTSNLIWMAGRP